MSLDILAQKYGIKLVILFGSQARGSAGRASDTDVAVLADHELSLSERSVIIEQVAAFLNASEDRIDLVDLWSASPLLQHTVGGQGKLLFGEQFDFVRFRVLAWKRYLDTAKFRRARRGALQEHVARNH